MRTYARVIHESGQDILLIDFSGLSGDVFLKAVETVKHFILGLPGENHLPSITDLSGARVSPQVGEAMKRMGKEIAHKKGHDGDGITKVVIGLSRLQRRVAGAITPGIIYLDTREQAIARILRDARPR